MHGRSPVAAFIAALVVLVALVGGGRVLGFGPLAPPPPDKVTDPAEMLARSLQSTIDASSVHLEGRLSGTLPGRLVGSGDASVDLAGTLLAGDIRAHDGKTRLHVTSPGLDLDAEAVTSWGTVTYRTGPDEPWQQASLGDESAKAGVDINPLTLVDRLRAWLATPGIEPSSTDVACGSASGRCHRVTVDAGHDPAVILRALLPAERAADLPDVRTTLTLDTDSRTLRPFHLVLDAASDDGSLVLHVQLDASRWDAEDIVIEEPSAAS